MKCDNTGSLVDYHVKKKHCPSVMVATAMWTCNLYLGDNRLLSFYAMHYRC